MHLDLMGVSLSGGVTVLTKFMARLWFYRGFLLLNPLPCLFLRLLQSMFGCWKKQLMSTSRQYARLRRARNPNLIFRDPPQPWVSDLPVLAHGLPLNTIHVEEDCLWLHSIDGVQVGHCVSQLQCTYWVQNRP